MKISNVHFSLVCSMLPPIIPDILHGTLYSVSVYVLPCEKEKKFSIYADEIKVVGLWQDMGCSTAVYNDSCANLSSVFITLPVTSKQHSNFDLCLCLQ
jgi:hypothetical protein